MENLLLLENRHTGEVLRLRRVRDASGETVLLIEGSLPPRANGPPLHLHYRQRESGVVKAGTLGARVGNEKITIPAGGSAAFEAGVAHKWWNAGDDPLQFNGQAVPAVDLDRFLQAVIAILNAGPKNRPSVFYLAHVAWRHRQTQALVNPPKFIQAILFPLIILVGKILGKYRGTGWPGSPESCTGAPVVELASQ